MAQLVYIHSALCQHPVTLINTTLEAPHPTKTMADTSLLSDSVARQDDETLNGDAKEPSLASEFKEIAIKLFHEEFVLIEPEEYTQFLAAQDADLAVIREHYMDLFRWDPSLVRSTRLLCQKLYLKGESQEIDRILLAFTKSYLKQHPDNAFCTTDFEKIYIVLYSLILLNTALHNVEISKKSKISQADYIRNTLLTFLQQNKRAARKLTVKQKIQIERELNLYYEDLARHELYLKRASSDSTSSPSTPRKGPNTNRYLIAETIRSAVLQGHEESPVSTPQKDQAGPSTAQKGSVAEVPQSSNASLWLNDADNLRRPSLAIKRMTSTTSATSQQTAATLTFSSAPGTSSRFGFTRALMSDVGASRGQPGLRNQRSIDHLRLSNGQFGHPLARKLSRNSIVTTSSMVAGDDAASVLIVDEIPLPADAENSGHAQQLEDFDVEDYQDRFDLKLELQGAPYLKEGLLRLRILNNDQADSAGASETPVSSVASTTSSSGRSSFFSFFSRSKEPVALAHVGTSSNLFLNKYAEYFVVVSKGELRLYSFDPKLVKKQQAKMKKMKTNSIWADECQDEDDDDIGDGNWLKNAAHVGNYNLCSTVAQIEKLIQSANSKKVLWTLTFPKVSKRPQKKFIFESGTVEVANEFIHTCNFWASKITAVPTLEESMSSLEYGWTNLDGLARLGDAFKKTRNIKKWEQIPKGVYLSNYVNSDESEQNHDGLLKQFAQTSKYYNNLKSLYNSFNKSKLQFMSTFRRFSGTSNYKLIASNFEAKAEEYKCELTKYKSYLIMLAFGLKLRLDLELETEADDWAASLREEGVPEEEISENIAKRHDEAEKSESQLLKLVRAEITKMTRTSVELHALIYGEASLHYDVETVGDDVAATTLVKSPKTFSFTNFKEVEASPISQLLSADPKPTTDQGLHLAKKELIMSFSTNTIKEEEEPEDAENLTLRT